MFRSPDLSEVQEVAASLGFPLSAEDAELYRANLAEQLTAFDDFVQARIPVMPAPTYAGAREPGYRPTDAQDPHNSWVWRCEIAGAEDGLLRGRTVSYKDHVAVRGIPASYGAFALEGHIPNFDATVVSRVLEAGGTVTGKNVMNGLAGGYGFGGAVGDYGRPLNPHNPDHLTGGSSSGSASALVLGEVDISFGGDQGGSIRIPASWSGCVGLKPTFGLVSHFGIGFGSEQSIDYTGPMTMTIDDCAMALEATAGRDGLDPRQTPTVPEKYDATSKLDAGIKGLKVGILDEGFTGAAAEVADSLNEAVSVLEQLGASVTKVSVAEHGLTGIAQQAMGAEGGLTVLNTLFFGMWAKTYYPADTIAAITEAFAHHRQQLDPRAMLTHMSGVFAKRYFSGRLYAKAHNVRPAIVAAYDKALSEVDVLVMPTTLTQAPQFEELTREERLSRALAGATALKATNNTRPFNYTGHPALSVPVGKRGGLPVGLQLVGRMFEDDLLLRAGAAYVSAVPFADYVAIGG